MEKYLINKQVEHILEAWENRDKSKADNDNISRIAQSFNMTNFEIVKILESNNE